jgi:hypothetical protein
MIVIRSEGKPIEEPKFVIEIVDDPVESARASAQDEQLRRNLHWMQEHWV